jgi:hypothetical protein
MSKSPFYEGVKIVREGTNYLIYKGNDAIVITTSNNIIITFQSDIIPSENLHDKYMASIFTLGFALGVISIGLGLLAKKI